MFVQLEVCLMIGNKNRANNTTPCHLIEQDVNLMAAGLFDF